ncbi:hypothetical protein TNCV_499861 [Trichonephila clavipes]|nr:hypothetical protein TNCV_499861 [Trichonephila clavipes]
MSSSPVPLKTHRVGQRCTLNLSRVETSSRWCGEAHWPSGSVSRFHVRGSGFYRRAGQGRLNLSSPQWVDKEHQACLESKTLGVSLQIDHLIGTSAHAPQRSMVTYTEMGTVGLGPHGLLRR